MACGHERCVGPAMIAREDQESQRRCVSGVVRKIRISLGLEEAPKAKQTPQPPVPIATPGVRPSNHGLTREQILINRYLCGACSLLENTVRVSLDQFVVIVRGGGFDDWLSTVSKKLDKFQPRMLTGLQRRVMDVLEDHSNGILL